MISIWSESYIWHIYTVCYSLEYLCSDTIIHDVQGEERVEEFEVIYLSLEKKKKTGKSERMVCVEL